MLVETKESSGLYKYNVKNFLFSVKHISVLLERSEATVDRKFQRQDSGRNSEGANLTIHSVSPLMHAALVHSFLLLYSI